MDLVRTGGRILAIIREDRLLLAGLILLVCLDAGFLALHFGRELAMLGIQPFTELSDVRLSLLYTGSYGDQYSRVLAAFVFGSHAFAFYSSREPAFGLASVAYLVIFIVATFRLHHPAGEALSAFLGFDALSPSLSNRLGAALVLGLVGSGALAVVLWGSSRSSRGPAQVGLLMAASIAGLGLFSGGLRLVNVIMSVDAKSLSRNLMGIEEGAELFVLTAALAVAVSAARYPRRLSIGQ